MKSLKYVIFNYRFPVLFPTSMDHDEIAHAMQHMTATSAGFVSLDGDGLGFCCFGRSESIGLESSIGDSMVLSAWIGR